LIGRLLNEIVLHQRVSHLVNRAEEEFPMLSRRLVLFVTVAAFAALPSAGGLRPFDDAALAEGQKASKPIVAAEQARSVGDSNRESIAALLNKVL
jgi:hypothetical protein